MLKLGAGVWFAIIALLPTAFVLADDTQWKPVTDEAALQFLKRAREATGELFRFDVEYLRDIVDVPYGQERRSRVRVYGEDPEGFLIEIKAIDDALMHTSRCVGRSGTLYRVVKDRPETWLYAKGLLTVLDGSRHTYEAISVSQNACLFGGGEFLTDWAHQSIPLWLDPILDWNNLKSQFRIVQAASTPTQFLVKLILKGPVPRSCCESAPWGDERLKKNHTLIIDRRTLRPKRWSMEDPQSHVEQILIYTSFDPNPPRRELKVSLTGYKKSEQAKPIPGEELKPMVDPAVLLGGRILFWLLL